MKPCRLFSVRFVLLLCSLVLAFALSSTSHAMDQVQPTSYDYPFNNRLISTLTSAIVRADTKTEDVPFEYRRDRRDVPLMKNRNVLNLQLYRQSHPAPLMFMIAGLGGTSSSGTALVLAETYFNAGYNVVTLPSTLSWQYTVAVSETGIPGYMPRDSKEYYNFLKAVTNHLVRVKGVQASSYAISGISMGGLLAAFVANEDQTQQTFNFKKVVLINPAIDLGYGIQVLDGLYNAGDKYTDAQKQKIMGFVIGLGEHLLNTPVSLNSFRAAEPELSKLNENELQWVIGQNFRQSIRDVVITGQRVHPTGFFKTQATKYQQSALNAEANRCSFLDYMNLLVYPSIAEPGFSKSEAIQQSSLYALSSFLKNNPKVFVFENEDDPIVKPSDFAFLKASVGQRLKVYPHGGHLGNLWWGQNKSDLRAISSFTNDAQ